MARSSFIRVEPHCERRHCCTTGREASEHRWTVGRGGDNVLLHSGTAALLDERMNLGGGKRRRRCPPSFKWVCNCARCGTAGREGKDGEHCKAHLHLNTAVLLDERMNLCGGKRRRRCPPSFKWGPKLRTLDKKLRMASTAMSSFIRALLDERLTSTAGWWAEAAAARYSFIRVELHYARRHCWTRG